MGTTGNPVGTGWMIMNTRAARTAMPRVRYEKLPFSLCSYKPNRRMPTAEPIVANRAPSAKYCYIAYDASRPMIMAPLMTMG